MCLSCNLPLFLDCSDNEPDHGPRIKLFDALATKATGHQSAAKHSDVQSHKIPSDLKRDYGRQARRPEDFQATHLTPAAQDANDTGKLLKFK